VRLARTLPTVIHAIQATIGTPITCASYVITRLMVAPPVRVAQFATHVFKPTIYLVIHVENAIWPPQTASSV
jgi:hypothetical protein